MEDKIKVIHIVGRMDRAGQETFIMNVFRNIDKTKFEFHFSVNTSNECDFDEEILNMGGCILHNIPFSLTNSIKYAKNLRNYLRINGPFQVIHSHVYYFSALVMIIAYLEGIPIRITHSHSTNDGKRGDIFRKIIRKTCASIIKIFSNRFIGCSDAACLALFGNKCGRKLNSIVVNNAIDINQFNNEVLNLEKEVNNFNINLKTKVFISVARFSDVKNHKKTISVFNKYIDKYSSECMLLLVGSGELENDIKEIVKDRKLCDKVLFLGTRTDINRLLSISDVFLMPSKFEGLPVSLVEAQAAGVNCVISDVITKEIDMNLDLVRYIGIEDTDDNWCKVIDEVLKKDRLGFKDRINALTEQGYNIEYTCSMLEKIYSNKE